MPKYFNEHRKINADGANYIQILVANFVCDR